MRDWNGFVKSLRCPRCGPQRAGSLFVGAGRTVVTRPRVTLNSKPITLSLGARSLEATRVTPESAITDVLSAGWGVVSSDPCGMIMRNPVL